jgi:choline dehydrogenase
LEWIVVAYDFVVVGGGTAGSVLASRLTENSDTRVLLLEAGPANGPAEMNVPTAWPTLLGGPMDWGYSTVAQRGLNGSVVPYPRGKVLGGSSSINAMAYVRAHSSSYDAWVEAGATGWGYDDLLPYFRRSEDTHGRDEHYRGVGGPMKPRQALRVNAAALACLESFMELGYPVTLDLNGSEPEGACRYELSVVDGVRQSVADAYLRPVLDRPNLTVTTDAFVHVLTFSGSRCTGVRYRAGGQTHTVTAEREVLLSAGVIGSPQLLQLSGIGPADALRTLGIEVRADLPGVGQNMSDHPSGVLVYSASQPMPEPANNHVDILAALRTDPALNAPDLHVLFADIPLPTPGLLPPDNGYTISFNLLQPHSRGSVALASNDPEAPPLIDPAFLTDERDVTAMLAGMRIAREVGAARALAPWRGEEVFPGPGAPDSERGRDLLLRSIGSYWHGVGTCRMGTDGAAVTDLALRVRGVDGLRVVDASVMPSVPAANTNATVLAIAERAAALIREETA